MQWLMSNCSAILSVLSAALSAGVGIAHLVHADSVATKIQEIEDAVKKLGN